MSIATAHTRLRSPLDALDRLGPFRSAIPLVVGILAWGGLYLRDSRLRQLIPFRRPA